jgi:hypothetical protein
LNFIFGHLVLCRKSCHDGVDLMTTEARKEEIGAKWTAVLFALAGCLALGLLFSHGAAASGKVGWFQIKLEQGEVNGYHWVVGAKGPKHRPLSRICAELSMVEPPQEGAPYVEGRDATNCSRLRPPIHSVFGTEAFGSGPSRVAVFEGLYRPIVRKVTFVLATGERRVFLPRVPKIPNQSARGIPSFRYFAAPFEGETCVRRVATFDGAGKIVSNEARPPCPGGTGNL